MWVGYALGAVLCLILAPALVGYALGARSRRRGREPAERRGTSDDRLWRELRDAQADRARWKRRALRRGWKPGQHWKNR